MSPVTTSFRVGQRAIGTGHPCLIQSPTDLASGYMVASATPAEDPNQIIEPPKPTA